MKKQLFFIVTLVTAILFVGCNKEEEKEVKKEKEEETVIPKNLAGIWNSENRTIMIDNKELTSERFYETVTIYADGRVEFVPGLTGICTVDGTSITFILTDSETGETINTGKGYTYETNDDNVGLLKFEVQAQTYSIKNNSRLIIEKKMKCSYENGTFYIAIIRYTYTRA